MESQGGNMVQKHIALDLVHDAKQVFKAIEDNIEEVLQLMDEGKYQQAEFKLSLLKDNIKIQN